MPVNYFDESIAGTYERKWPHLFEPEAIEPVVDFLAAMAGGKGILELGIGTGRVALPLARRGVPVHGIELSPAMVAELRRNAGSDAIGVTIGDMATVSVGGVFSLAYLVRNTIMNLTTQDAQVRCFLNVASHLEAGGRFVIEVMVPQLQRLPAGEMFRIFDATPTHVGLEEYDVANQTSISHHYWIADAKAEYFAAPFRYVWPAELDLMARIAGLVPVERWSDWTRAPFTKDSRSHVSVWQKRL